jgi:hypothetical protein
MEKLDRRNKRRGETFGAWGAAVNKEGAGRWSNRETKNRRAIQKASSQTTAATKTARKRLYAERQDDDDNADGDGKRRRQRAYTTVNKGRRRRFGEAYIASQTPPA